MKQTIHIADMTTMLPSTDIELARNFYRDILGFSVVHDSAQIVRLELGSYSLYFVPESPPTPDKPDLSIAVSVAEQSTPVNLTFRVESVDAVYDSLRRQGIEFLAEPNLTAWGEKRVFTRDPDGYLIEFYQPGAEVE